MPVFINTAYNVQMYYNCIPSIENRVFGLLQWLKKEIVNRELLTVVGKKGLNLNFFKHIEQV